MKQVYHTVYLITNLINGTCYIGKHTTENPMDRYMGSGLVIRQALNKYGKENFEKKILGVFAEEEDAFHYECLCIAEYKERGVHLYNILAGGQGITRDYMVARWKEPSYRLEMDKTVRRINATTDVNERRSLTCRALWDEPKKEERRLEMLNLWKDETYRTKVSEGLKKHWEENFEARRKINQEINSREEVKAKHSQNTRRKWKDPEYVEKTNAARAAAMSTPEFKEMKSRSTKQMWSTQKQEILLKRKQTEQKKLDEGFRRMRRKQGKGGTRLVHPEEINKYLSDGWVFQ